MTSSINVLIVGAGSVVGLSATRLISQYKGIERVIVGNTNPYFAARNYATDFIITPDFYFSKTATEVDYLDFLLTYCQRHKIDVLISGSIFELECLSQNVRYFEAIGTRVIIEKTEMIKTFYDKYLTTIKLNSITACSPSSGELSESEFDLEVLQFPCFIKPRFGYGSNGIAIIQSATEYRKWLKNRHTKYSPYIWQEYLDNANEEYTCSVVYDRNGEPFDVCAVRRLSVNKVTVDAEYVESCKSVEELIIEIAKHLEGRYCLNFQFRMKNGKPYIFEINPRFGASEGIRAQFGHDPYFTLLNHYYSVRNDQAERGYGRVIRAYKEEFFSY